jgi:hypothetical protein
VLQVDRWATLGGPEPMPLKAKALHSLVRADLGPFMAALGFKTVSGTMTASWCKPVGPRYLVLFFQPSSWNDSYSPGFRFTVELRLGKEPSLSTWGPRQRLPQLLDQDERAELLELENSVVPKLPPPDPEVAALLSGPTRENWLASWERRIRPYGPDEDVWFRHWDETDVRALIAFFKRVLPSAVNRFLTTASKTEESSPSPG